ncbi:MAG: FAD binding domain-containing protein [Calditrichia bacterium]|nr:FAD binding domain-containing protein [Calditrichia bacterium]
MIPDIEFFKPGQLGEVLEMLYKRSEKNEKSEKNGESENIRPLAGGTDILPGFHQASSRFIKIEKLIDINGIPELKKMEKREKHLVIGAAVTFTDIEKSQDISSHFPLLSKAASTIGSRQIRNRATIAGNFVNNAPCADSVTPLLVYDTWVTVESVHGSRQISLQEFLVKPYKTRLQSDELITEILIPWLPENYKGDFYKLGRRRAVAISRITLSVLGNIENSTIKDFRIASGAVTPIGKRFYKLEEAVKGEKISSSLFKTMAQELGRQILDVTGLRWSSPHKLPVVQQTFYQLLENTFL